MIVGRRLALVMPLIVGERPRGDAALHWRSAHAGRGLALLLRGSAAWARRPSVEEALEVSGEVGEGADLCEGSTARGVGGQDVIAAAAVEGSGGEWFGPCHVTQSARNCGVGRDECRECRK